MVLQGGLPADQQSDRSRGKIVACRLQQTDRYDHTRHHALRTQKNSDRSSGQMLFVWDFVLTLDNGTEIYLHPSYTQRKFPCFIGLPQTDHEVPRTGRGGTNGPGTFKYFKEKKADQMLRFKPDDPAQGTAKAKGQAKPKAA